MFSYRCFLPLLVVVNFGCTPKQMPENIPQAEEPIRDLSKEDVPSLLRKINDLEENQRHFDFTPAVFELMNRGPEIIPQVLPLLEHNERATRIRAQRVLEGITMRLHGFTIQKGWPTTEDRERWEAWWKTMGDLDADAPLERRAQSLAIWKQRFPSRKV